MIIYQCILLIDCPGQPDIVIYLILLALLILFDVFDFQLFKLEGGVTFFLLLASAWLFMLFLSCAIIIIKVGIADVRENLVFENGWLAELSQILRV